MFNVPPIDGTICTKDSQILTMAVKVSKDIKLKLQNPFYNSKNYNIPGNIGHSETREQLLQRFCLLATDLLCLAS